MKYSECSQEKVQELRRYRREYYERNKDKIYENSRRSATKRREENPEEFVNKRRERGRIYGQTAKGIYKVIRERCKSDRYNLEMTQDEFVQWYNSQDKKCVFCDIPHEQLDKIDQIRLSIDRIDNTKGYNISNIQLACLICNRVKNNIFSNKEIREIAQKYIKPKWINQQSS